MASDTYIFPRGTNIYYTTQATHIVAPPTAAAALPTTFPLAAPDLGTDPTTDWVAFGCIESVTGLGQIRPELTEHRCLNGTSDIVEKLQTGFKTPETLQMTLTWNQEEEEVFRDLRDDRGVVRLLVVLPVRSDHTDPYHFAHRYYVNTVNIDMNDLSNPIKLNLELEIAFDSGVYVLGS